VHGKMMFPTDKGRWSILTVES